MTSKIDLHLHTNRSDGLLSPAELVRRVRDAGVCVAAVTDHDTVAGIPEAMEEAARVGLRLIPGAELSIECAGQDIHILAYFVDTSDPPFLRMLDQLRVARTERLRRILDRLRRLGMPLKEEQVREFAPPGGPIGRPHIASALAAARWVPGYYEAFRYYLGDACPAYIPNRTPSPEESLRILLASGAVPVLAHPAVYHLEGVLDRFVAAGLMGLEVYHPSHDPATVEHLRGLARDLELLETGGSDYHGEGRGDTFPGSIAIGADVLPRLEAARTRVREVLRRRHGHDPE